MALRPRPLKHGTFRREASRRRKPVTVCIAALFNWWAHGRWTRVVMTASDRMITRGSTEYQLPQMKICELTNKALVLVAGEIVAHSEAVRETQKSLAASPGHTIREIAEIFGSHLAAYTRRQAVQTYLRPIGLDEEGLIARQATMAPHLVTDLTAQLQNHRIDAEAIVCGCDDTNGHIYHVNHEGFVTCHDDVGFIAIGIGAPHAESMFMARAYANWWNYWDTVLLTYAAKKRGEVAPGVGEHTDMLFVSPAGIERIREDVMKKVAEIYERESKEIAAREQVLGRELHDFIKTAEATASTQPSQGPKTDRAPSDLTASPAAPSIDPPASPEA